VNLFFRLIYTLLVSRFRSACPPLGPCRTPFRVWPSDLDVLRHMNNGVYLSILDLARVDLMIRSGVFRKLNAQGWYPVIASETIQFRKSLELFDRFDVITQMLGWDDKAFLLLQQFERRGAIIATAAIRARFLKRSGGTVSPQELLSLVNHTGPAPELPDWVRRWNDDQVALREGLS
jgi:acyl-CoA thioesterase FadM